ncbi:MAG: hypothetical protein J2O44_01035 [Porphyrobacter sp.]|nr:hypothetical protein [Porphyrobacter sp.]
MWIIIGAILIALMVIAARWFLKATAAIKLNQAVKEQIWINYKLMFPYATEMDAEIWSDSYFLGYIQGESALMSTIYGRGLSTMRRGMVLIEAIKDFYRGDYREICQRIEDLNSTKNPAFIQGAEHGANVAILMADKAGPALLAEPEVQIALKEAPAQQDLYEKLFGQRPRGQTQTAGTILMTNYMHAHRDRLNR